MNVFVLSTGRCGSRTFAQACSHIENYTAGHETRTERLFGDRLSYPDRHIESDNRLSWLLGRLDETYGDRAFYVHLTRDREGTAASYNRRWHLAGGVMSAYAHTILFRNRAENLDVCLDYCDTVNSNIRMFLKDKPNQMEFRLEHAAADFRLFWERIGAHGDRERALQEWDIRYNTRAGADRPEAQERSEALLWEAFRKDPTRLEPLSELIQRLIRTQREPEAMGLLGQTIAGPRFRRLPIAIQEGVRQLMATAYQAAVPRAVQTGQFTLLRQWTDFLARNLDTRAPTTPARGAAAAQPSPPGTGAPLATLAEADELLAQGRHVEAATRYRQALTADPSAGEAVRGLVKALVHVEPRAAVPILEQALARQPDSSDIQASLTRAYLDTGQLDMAVRLVAQPHSAVGYELATRTVREFAASDRGDQVAQIRDGVRLFRDFLRVLGRDPEPTAIAASVLANYLHPTVPWREQALDLCSDEELDRWVTWSGLERLQALYQEKRGLILVLSHFAAERVAPLLLSRAGIPINSLEFRNRLADHGIAGARRIQVMEIQDRTGFPLRELYLAQRALRRGEVFQLAGDGYQGGSEVVLDFLGRRRPFKTGFPELALASGAPAVPVFCTVAPDGAIRIDILPPLDPGSDDRPRGERVEALLRQYAALLAERWQADPANLVWDHLRRFLELPAAPS